MIESVDGEYVSVSTYSPQSWSSYVELYIKLKNFKKGLINIKNEHKKCFLWCYIRHSNTLNTHQERIRKKKNH